MKMTKVFQRRKGGVAPPPFFDTLDPTPANFPGGVPKPADTVDNVLIAPYFSDQGWPAHRVAVTYMTDAVAPISLNAQLWLYDHETDHWYKQGTAMAGNLLVDQVTFFDVVAIVSSKMRKADLATPTQGCIEAMLIVKDPGVAPNGVYTFGMAADLTTLPI